MSRFRQAAATVGSFMARNPPIFARPSFLADIVHPSASANISATISLGVWSSYPGSRSLTNHEFSANRHASRKKGIPWRSQTSRTSRRLAMETGCPPPELFVTVTITIGIRSTPTSEMVLSRAAMSMFPLNGCSDPGSRPSAMTRSRASAPWYSTLARVVSKWVLLGTTSPSLTITEKRIRSAARPWWVGMISFNPVIPWTVSRKR